MSQLDLSHPLDTTSSRPGTREALLDAAESLFAAHGYAAVGVREIVERAGANIAAVNYHFGSKGDLYLETVRRAMQRRNSNAVWDALRADAGDPNAAAAVLVQFIRGFLAHVTDSAQPASACSLLIHEAAEPSEAVDAVVRDFIRPHQQAMLGVIAAVSPALEQGERLLHAESIMGQLLHYRVFRPFIERLGVCDLDRPGEVSRIADHIARVALRALLCDEAMIDRAVGTPRTASQERESA